MGSSGDMANSEKGISKLELKSMDYKQSSIAAIQRRQRDSMKWQMIGKLIAVLFAAGFLLWLYYTGL